MKDKEKLIDEAFDISEHIRYIAVYDNEDLSMKQRSDINNVSSNDGHVNIGVEPDKNPFLFVEPLNTLLRKYNLN